MATGLGEVLGWFVGLSGFGTAAFTWGMKSSRIKKEDVVSSDDCTNAHKLLEERLAKGCERFEKGDRQFNELKESLVYVQYLLRELATDEQQQRAEEKMHRFERQG